VRKCAACGMPLAFREVISGKDKHAACAAREEERARQEELARVEAEKQQAAERRVAEREAYRQRHGFASIIGQDNVLQRLQAFAALYADERQTILPPDVDVSLEPRVPGHILLTGAEGIGRRTIGRAFAIEYCGQLIEVDMRNLSRTGDLMGPLTNFVEGDVLIIRHLERTPRVLEDFVVSALKEFRVDFVVGKGMFAKTITVPLKRFTCIATAHSEAQCPREVAEAFHLVLQLESYPRKELALICQRLAEQRGLSLCSAGSAIVAGACDGTPHHVDVLVSRLAASGKAAMDEEEVAHILSVLGLAANTADSHGGAGDLGKLSGTDFEKLIAELLRRMGFQTSLTKASGDGGIDIVAMLDRPIIGGRFLIQCKRFAPDNMVGSATVREFYGALTAERGAAKGIFITTADFTAQAREFAEDLPIELIGGFQLLRLLSDHGLAMQGGENPRGTGLFDEPI
jgi:Holliday junction resolvasome RuvABC ATP-dependent DNA helicase subunit